MIYRIYPPIGIARLGNSPTEYFIASESISSMGTEIKTDGSETELTEYKTGNTGDPDTAFKVKKQAARFRLYEFDDENSEGRPAQLPNGTKIEWSVQLVNKKDAVIRPNEPPAETPDKIELNPGREQRIIDSGLQSIGTDSTDEIVLKGKYIGHEVKLGELKLDKAGNLLVLGGDGISETFEGAGIGDSFYNNPNWHDDVSDGPVNAKIISAGGVETEIQPAWVIIAPPDFAPDVKGIVTLYDVILQSAKDAGLVTLKPKPSFTLDILPLIKRANGLQWVHDDVAWTQVSTNFATLADPAITVVAKNRRKNTVKGIQTVETAFDHGDYNFSLCRWQNEYLELYINGGTDFVSDYGTAVQPDPLAPNVLTRTILDGTVGEGLFPGIEAGRILANSFLYTVPFTFHLDPLKVKPGDLTALMALPWQADFKKCDNGWWPSQRPNYVPGPAPRPDWSRGIHSHTDLVENVMKLGVITKKTSNTGLEVQQESGRDPNLNEV